MARKKLKKGPSKPRETPCGHLAGATNVRGVTVNAHSIPHRRCQWALEHASVFARRNFCQPNCRTLDSAMAKQYGFWQSSAFEEARPKAHFTNTYYHLVKLSLVLALRIYNAVPDSVLLEIIRHRATLRHCYRRAYLERAADVGAPINLRMSGKTPILLRGVFLDLQMNFSGGKLARFGPPRILSAYDALDIYANNEVASRSFLPINI
jgi:hypothetical protein